MTPRLPSTRHALFTAAILTAVASCLLLGGLGCKTQDKAALERAKPVTLKYWRVFDGEDTLNAALGAYRQLHPNVSVDYRVFRYEEFEQEVIDALAEDRGPDILSLQSTWMREWQPRLLTAPASLTLPYQEISSGLKKEVTWVLRTTSGPSVRQVQNDFIDAVAEDAVIPTEQADPRAPFVPQVYGLPLSVDTLVMFYNRDILNAAGIAQPARYWREFQEQVKKITKLDEVGTIIQSAAAIGTTDNVERSADILALLMMQNGTQMTDASGIATFDRFTPETAGQPLAPGAAALVFYNDFANPEKEVYTWNDKMPASLEAFVSGRAAYFFGYAYHLPLIRRLNPELNFGIAGFPQIEGNKPIHFANYWLEAVAKKTKYPNEAWDLVQFITKAEQAPKYLNATRKPTALRSLINGQLEDLDLSVFAAQLPTARTWYRGTDAPTAEKSFNDMIRSMLQGDADPTRLLELAATKVNQTVK